jgi:hypothetical protein
MANLAAIQPGQVTHATTVVGPFSTAAVTNVQVGVNVTAVAGTSPSLSLFFEVLGADGVWYAVWKPTAVTAAGQTVTTIGPAAATGAVFSAEGRLRLALSGTTPKFTLSADVHGH